MRVRALLVNPEFPDTFWSFRHSLPFLGKKASYPPLGLLTVAALLPEDWDLRVIDENVERLLAETIEWADIVLCTSMIVQLRSLRKVLARAKAMGKVTVLGGPYASSCRERPANVDCLVRGEAESSLADFASDWENGRLAVEYAERGEKPDLSFSSVPRFDLIRFKEYSSLSIQFSRGCPFDCEFCDITGLFGRRPRTKSPERVLDELSAIRSLGYRGPIFLVDDNFIGNALKAKEFLKTLIPWQEARRMPFSFHTEASVNLAEDPELVSLMAKAGFSMVFLGIETPDEACLAEAGKTQNLRSDPIESVRRIQASGIEVTAGFIVGFDADPPDIARRQADFIGRSGIATAMVGLLTALPGTRLERRLASEGRLRELSSGENTFAAALNFIPRAPESEVLESYERVLSDIYRPKAYFKRCLDLLATIPDTGRRPSGKPAARETPAYLLAFAASVVRQGFSCYGLDYFNFLAIVLARFPLLVPRAVKMAILGHHFFTLRSVKVVRRQKRLEAFSRALDFGARAISRIEAAWRGMGALRLARYVEGLWRRSSGRIERGWKRLDGSLAQRAEARLEEFGEMAGSVLRGLGRGLEEIVRGSSGRARARIDLALARTEEKVRGYIAALSARGAARRILESLGSDFVLAVKSARGA
jgi:radical SAM superfamily enzyme YgiQ (UPF0313 family)